MIKIKNIIINTLLIFFGIVLVDFLIEVLYRGTDFQIWLAYIIDLRVWLTRLLISIALAFYNVFRMKKREEIQKAD
ncbi:hypothetical protein [Belliella aquatica]|uniref:Uncharacterized protein n=1 Tax=Belliella aquatica TaxID=1323734 RepID=A0ABQ1M2Y5_9BACT|nr:hypothetical protein [Belliella aquatica]MCH7404870.1 hypothetical protein [Belliella aquatica]GGC33472.1 hypothetical protein GCM10010993_10470 [Belliella aquatica]